MIANDLLMCNSLCVAPPSALLLPGDCTPLMEAASGGYADIVSLLLDHGAEVNAKSAAGEF